MTWSIEFESSAQRSLHRLPEKVRDAALTFVYGQLAEHPRRVGKPLGRELSGLYSARRGSYRIVYRVADERVLVQVVRVGPRSDVYR